MNVTLRPNGIPDVYLNSPGERCDLAELDKHIRALQTARRWLMAEQNQVTQVQKTAEKKK